MPGRTFIQLSGFRRGLRMAVQLHKTEPPKEPLAVTHPQLAAEWHPAKNGNLTPKDVTYGNGKPVWWLCQKGHEWQASCNSRTSGGKGSGCPYCSNRGGGKANCLAAIHPDLARQWHPTKNGDLRPEDVSAGTHQKAWWQCPKGDDHEWEASIVSRVRGAGCPCCRGLKATRSTCLAATHPEIA